MGGMSQLVKDVARLFAGFTLTFGMYVMLHGHSRPGGGFAGGVIVAGGFVLLILSHGRVDGGFVPEQIAGRWQALAVLGLLLVGLLGLARVGADGRGSFFRNQPFPGDWPAGSLLSGGTALLSDLAIGTAVWMGLIAMFLALATFRRTSGEE
jgi:multisubunit Na+/H+ antiporter MnhB subunit